MDNMTTRKANALKTKERIYSSAIELFNEKGYENTTVRDIVGKAEIAIGTFYGHYKSKGDILNYTIAKYDSIAQVAYDECIQLTRFEDRLEEFVVKNYVGIKDIGNNILKAMYSLGLTGNDFILGDENRNVYRILNLIIQYGMDSGILDSKISVKTYREIIVTHLIGVDYYWITSMDEVNIDNIRMNIRALIYGLENFKSK